jgi:hypothetical protein
MSQGKSWKMDVLGRHMCDWMSLCELHFLMSSPGLLGPAVLAMLQQIALTDTYTIVTYPTQLELICNARHIVEDTRWKTVRNPKQTWHELLPLPN